LGLYVIIGDAGRVQTFLPATILFFALSLPMLLFFKDAGIRTAIKIKPIAEYRNFFSSFKTLLKFPGVGRYLLGYFLFNDAVLTASNNFPIYLQQVFGVSDKTKTFLLVGILITAALGALISGWISDKIGLKKSLLWILGGWTVLFPILSSLTDFRYFVIGAVFMGILYGSTWTVTRAVMAYLAPADQLDYAFSYYTLAERFSTFLGPLSWGLVTLLFVRYGPMRYHIALLLMSVFIFAGLLVVKKIPDAPREQLV